MAQPYPIEQTQRLTAKGKATLQELIDRDEHKMDDLRQVRADLMAEVASVDDVMADLRETSDRRRAKLRGDVISLLTPVPSLPAVQDDAETHAALFGGPKSATVITSVPDRDDPAGDCDNCGKAVWRTETSATSPTGFIHSFGATCDPENKDSEVAWLAGGPTP